MYHFGKQSLKNLVGVKAELVKVCYLALEEFTQIDFGVIDGLRTAEEQAELDRIKEEKTVLDIAQHKRFRPASPVVLDEVDEGGRISRRGMRK